MSLPKQKTIRKLRKISKATISQENLQVDLEQTQVAIKTDQKLQEVSKEIQDDNDLSQYKIIKPIPMQLKKVATLQPEDRERLKKNHPHIAEYVFLTQREKLKYFHQKNLKYNKAMELPGNLPARTIQFKRTFEVKVFQKQLPPKAVKSIKSFRDKYNVKIHYN